MIEQVSNDLAGANSFTRSLKSNYMLFFCAGMVVSPWAAIAPVIKPLHAMSDVLFALMSLCFGLGAMISMIFSGKMVIRFGVKKLMLVCYPLCVVSIIGFSCNFIAWWMTYPLAFLWGATLGVYEVAINVHATYFEARTGRRLLSLFTAVYTAGCIAATLVYPLMMKAGADIEYIASGSGIVAVMLFAKSYGVLINTHGQKEQKDGNSENPELSPWLLFCAGMVAFFALLAEGAVYDWSGVYLTADCALPLAYASLGFMFYEGSAGVVRFFGEKLTMKLGAKRLVCGGSVLAFIALLCSACFKYAPLVILSFAALGVAAGNIMPVIISETGRRAEKNSAKAISTVSAMAYAGVLTGPAFLGVIATVSSFGTIFSTVALLMILMGWMGRVFLQSGKNSLKNCRKN